MQEFIPARGGHIARVEVVGGKYLYGIKVHLTGETFDLCPADICKTTGGLELARAACPVEAPKTGLRVEGYTPPTEIIQQVERIMQDGAHRSRRHRVHHRRSRWTALLLRHQRAFQFCGRRAARLSALIPLSAGRLSARRRRQR